jgi:hypothetical protein
MKRGRGDITDSDHDGTQRRKAVAGSQQQGDQNIVNEKLANMMVLLEALAKRLKANKEGIDHSSIKQWRESLKSMSAQALRIQHSDQLFAETADEVINQHFKVKTDETIQDIIEKEKENEIEKFSDLKKMRKLIFDQVELKLAQYQVDSRPEYVAMLKLCETNPHKEDEDDILFDESEEMTEMKIRCPFTMQIMVEPYKK